MAARSRPFPWRPLVWVAAAVVVVGGGGAYVYRRHVAAAAAASIPPQYITQIAGVGSVSTTVSGSGAIQPAQSQTVDPQVAGTVGTVDVHVGQDVKAGQTLFQLVDSSGIGQQVTQAQNQLTLAEDQLQADQNPAASVNPLTVQQAQLKVQQAEDNLAQAQNNLSQARSQALADAQVTTPVAGTVSAVNVVNGQQVNAGTTIAVIQPSGAPDLTVEVAEEDLPYLPTGTAATISIPAVQQTVTGTVTAVANASSGQVNVNAQGEVVSGGNGTMPQAAYNLTVTPTQPLSGVPAGASATVTFTPHGHPPVTLAWSDGGTVGYPATVNATAQESGTVSGLPAVGAAVSAGQQLASVTPAPGASSSAQQDATAVQQDQIALQEAEISLSQTQNPQPATQQTIASAEATVAADQQTVAQREQQLSELTVTAPIGGVVTAVNVTPAQEVGPSTTGVSIESSNQFQAQVSIAESSVGHVAVGDPATVTVSALPGQSFPGKVATISPVASGGSGVSAYPVTIDLSKSAGLLSGMSATAVLTTQQVASTLRVPTAAVHTGAGGSASVSVLQGGKPVPTPVTTGLSSTQWTQVLSGVQPGQRVVVAVISGGAAARLRSAAATRTAAGGPGGGFRGGGFGGPGGGFAVVKGG